MSNFREDSDRIHLSLFVLSKFGALAKSNIMDVSEFRPDETQRDGLVSQQSAIGRWKLFLVFAALTLVHSLVYIVILPPWQSNDEHGHYEYAWLISQHGPLVGSEAISPEFQQRVLQSMYQFHYWEFCRQPMPDTFPSGFKDPNDPWLRYSRSQVGDDPPLYYAIVGGVLWLMGDPDVLVGMYVGRVISGLLFAITVGLMAVGMRDLFPESRFMQTVPPATMLLFPMLGQTSAAVNNDVMGVLTGTVFFITLIPIFRDGLTVKRCLGVVAALICAFLSKKTAWFLLATILPAVAIYYWTRGKNLPRRTFSLLGIGAGGLLLIGSVLALLPGGEADRWVEWKERIGSSCGTNRLLGIAWEGQAALRVGPCDYVRPTQVVAPDVVKQIAGQELVLTGWVRSQSGPVVGRVYVVDNESSSEIEVVANENWQSFAISHTMSADPRWLVVRLGWKSGEGLLFDQLVLSTDSPNNLLVNGSAEQTRSLLVSLLVRVMRWVRMPERIAEQILMPYSWDRAAWQDYGRIAGFVFQSFWGLFGSVTLFLPASWYQVLKGICLLGVVGNSVFVVWKCRRNWQTGYLLVLMCGVLLVILQTFLPMFGMRGADWMPQGRYLFSGIPAFSVLLAWGFYCLLPRRWEKASTMVSVLLALAFDVSCLVWVLIPYFRA